MIISIYVQAIIFFTLFPCLSASSSTCISNPFVDYFRIVDPIDNQLVYKLFYSYMQTNALNKTLFLEHKDEFEICAKANNIEYCHNNIFDEFLIDFTSFNITNGSTVILQKTLIHNTLGLLCTSSITLNCCVSEEQVSDYEDEQRVIKLNEYKSLLLSHTSTSYNNPQTPSFCQTSSSVSYIIGIKSAALNYNRRQLIRTTWFTSLHPCTPVRFLIGQVDKNDIDLNTLLDLEQTLHGDLLLGTDDKLPVRDSYHSLPEKVLYFLSYILYTYLPDKIHRDIFPFDYLVVADDDVYVNTTHLHAYLTDHSAQIDKQSLYAGEVSYSLLVIYTICIYILSIYCFLLNLSS